MNFVTNRIYFLMKHLLISLFCLLTYGICSAQVPVSQVEGRLEVFLPQDTTSIHVGWKSGLQQTTGTRNSFFGTDAGRKNSTGENNSFFGASAGADNAGGGRNSFYGASAGLANTTGGGNSFFGASSGLVNTEGYSNCFYGYRAGMSNSAGSDNNFFGRSAGLNNNDGDYNCFFGSFAGRNNQNGHHNIAIGSYALERVARGSYNVAIGDSSMYSLGSFMDAIGEKNTAVGTGSLFARSHDLSNSSVAIGYQAGYDGGTKSVFIGYQAGKVGTYKHDALYINNEAGDNPLIYGDFDTDMIRINGQFQVTENIGVGTTDPQAKIHIAGSSTEARMLFDNAGDIMWKTSQGAIRPVLTLHSDDNTYLDGEKDIVFRTKSDFQRRMRINENGNVGIGVDTPDATLHIKDFAKLEPINSPPACTEMSHVGRVYFDAGLNKLRVCVASSGWVNLH